MKINFPFILLIMLCSCVREDGVFSPVSELAKTPPGQAGSANVTITLGKIGTLSKVAASASISLCSLRVALTAAGETAINWTTPVSGSGPITVSRTFTGLAEKTWLLSAETRDTRNAVLHSGAVSFTVIRKKTVNVNLSISSKYSMLVAKFFPICDSVNQCILLVDGITRGDSSFTKQLHVGDTIPLRYDYLATGISHNISMRARGSMWGIDTLLYSGDTSITITAGVDGSFRVTLRWVGPSSPPPGQAEMFVMVGSFGSVVVTGIIDD
jgi:hypothetical protein